MQATDTEPELSEKVRQIQDAITEFKGKILDLNVETEILEAADGVKIAMDEFKNSVHTSNSNMVSKIAKKENKI